MPENTVVGRLIWGLDAQGISQARLGRRLGISPMAVTHWKNADNIPSKHLMEIERFTGMGWSFLYKGDPTGLRDDLRALWLSGRRVRV